jgi:ligand-binding sensor domain-containing protein
MVRASAVRLLLLVLLAATLRPLPARAMAGWSTFIRMENCNDVLAQRDTVWLASSEAGILRYFRSTGTFESITREPSGLASNAVTSLAFDRSGRLWAGASGKGASRLAADGASWDLLNAFDGLPSDSVTVLRADGDTVWIGTTRGIALWNGRLVAGSVPDIGTASPFRSNMVTGIVVLGDTLLVATTDGVYASRLSTSLASWWSVDAGLSVTSVTRLATTGQRVFALLFNGFVYELNRVTNTWFLNSTASRVKNLRDGFGHVTLASRDSLCVLAPGGGWTALAGGPLADASTSGGVATGSDPLGKVFAVRFGVLYEQGAPWAQHVPPGPAGNDINNILSDGHEVWAHASAHGVSRFDGTTWTNWLPGCCGPNQTASFMNPIYSYTLQFDRTGHLWTSHWDTGIERVDTRANPLHVDHAFSTWGVPKADTLSRHSDGWSSAVDSAGYVYIGGDTPDLGGGTSYDPMGVDVYNPAGQWIINWRTTSALMRSNQTRAIAYDRINATLWVGWANKGIGYFDLSDIDSDADPSNLNDHLKLPQFQYISSLLNKNVFGVVAHNDSIWVLSDNDLRRVKGSTRTAVSTLDILAQPAPIGSVHPLDVARDGTVWAASVEGVRRFKPGGGHVDFNVENSPLADNEVRSLCVEPVTGVLWFGTASGINRYDPNYAPPPVPRLPSLTITVYPNPVRLFAMGAALQLKGNAGSYEGEIMDITGRVVRKFTSAANGAVIWNGRDRDGNFVRSGIYFVHTRGGGHEATARVVVLR